MSNTQSAPAAPPATASRTAPHERGYPLLGVAPSLLRDPLSALSRLAYQHPEEIVSLQLGPMRAWLVTHPPHVEHVLHTRWRNYAKQGPVWQALRRIVGNGLVASEGPTWVTSRRLVQPLFNHQHLAQLTGQMISTMDRTLGELAERSRSGQSVELFQEMNILTQNVLLECVFGVPMPRPQAEHLGAMLTSALREVNLRMLLSFLPERMPLLGDARLRRAILEIDAGLLDLRRRWEQSRSSAHTSLLALLEAAKDPETGQGMSPQQVRDELRTLWVAGAETTATVMTWVWCMLAQHPEVEARVRAEVAATLGDRAPAYADLERLRYCRQVLLETMRLYPPSWFMPRQSVEEDVVDGYLLPAGELVITSQYITHRAPSLWEEPERFDPERFSLERSAGRHPYAYLPFGGGPRRCLGEHFSMIEALLILAMMVQRFRPRPVPGLRVEPQSATVLRPRGEVRFTLH